MKYSNAAEEHVKHSERSGSSRALTQRGDGYRLAVETRDL